MSTETKRSGSFLPGILIGATLVAATVLLLWAAPRNDTESAGSAAGEPTVAAVENAAETGSEAAAEAEDKAVASSESVASEAGETVAPAQDETTKAVETSVGESAGTADAAVAEAATETVEAAESTVETAGETVAAATKQVTAAAQAGAEAAEEATATLASEAENNVAEAAEAAESTVETAGETVAAATQEVTAAAEAGAAAAKEATAEASANIAAEAENAGQGAAEAVGETLAAADEGAAASAVSPLATQTPAAGGLSSLTLPSGEQVDVAPQGVEAELIAFIEDDSRPIDKKVWFEFDRLSFASGSANLTPGSQAQIDAIVAILNAYPNVHIKIGGYTDNTGDAELNLKLSDDRAKAVMAALVAKGIAEERLAAEGYGDLHPVASNDTAEGRAKNRRTALSVRRR